MEKESARILLESFVAKIHKDTNSGIYRCDGMLSVHEVEALITAVEALGGKANRPDPDVATPVAVQGFPLVLDANEISKPEQEGALLCLDFGTAMSKAACTANNGLDLVDLELGVAAGATDSPYGLPSSIFIGKDGIMHFGPAAISASLDEGGDRKRLDSLKQFLSQGQLGDLARRNIDKSVNPTDIPFTQADAIQIYLAYLTDIACTELEKAGVSRYVRRRFAMPSWKSDRKEWAEGELRKLLARAQILADTLHGQWNSGLQLARVVATLRNIDLLDSVPDYLIFEGVAEPVASAASRVRGDQVQIGMFVVVDVGAGTTDFAAFWVVQNEEDFKVWLIKDSVCAVEQAGDTIDGYLQDEILKAGHLTPGHPDFPFAVTKLSLERRQLKETLFRSGQADAQLPNGTTVRLRLDGFLASDAIRGFEDRLHKELTDILSRIDRSWVERLSSFGRLGKDAVTLVFSGGGSVLPMVKNLAQGYFEVDGIKLGKNTAPEFPEWISENYPRLVKHYPPLAVAIGGSEPELPELKDTLEAIVAPSTKEPSYRPAVQYKN